MHELNGDVLVEYRIGIHFEEGLFDECPYLIDFALDEELSLGNHFEVSALAVREQHSSPAVQQSADLPFDQG